MMSIRSDSGRVVRTSASEVTSGEGVSASESSGPVTFSREVRNDLRTDVSADCCKFLILLVVSGWFVVA